MTHKGRKLTLLFCTCSFLFSCARMDAPTHVGDKGVIDEETVNGPIALPIAKQVLSVVKEGLNLEFSSFLLSIPGKEEGKDNNLHFDGSEANLRIDSLSLHGIEADFHAELDYNGVAKQVDLLLAQEELYFSLLDEKDDFSTGYGGIRFKSNIAPCFDHIEREWDEQTRGKVYFEYGSLDYFLYSVFESFELPSFSLKTSDESKAEIDVGAIMDSLEDIESIDSHHFVLTLPLGEETLEFGLYSDSQNVLNRIVLEEREFSNGMSLSFDASVKKTSKAFATPVPENTYLELEDSLALVRKIGEKVSKKEFGLDIDLSLSHAEGAVEGDSEAFSRDPISESGTLVGEVDVDMDGQLNDVTANLVFSSAGSNETAFLHMENNDGKPLCYFDFNGVLRGFSEVSAFSHLFSTLSSSLKDDSIQNETIMKLLVGLLATSKSLSEAIDAITGSGVYQDFNEGHYEHILSSLVKLGHQDNRIYAVLDLASAGASGKASIEIDSNNANLLSVVFEDAGIVTASSPSLSLLVNGTIKLREYEKLDFDLSGYPEFRHIPSIDETIQEIAESDQLTVGIQGYLSKKGTTAVTSYTIPGWNGNTTLSTQGFSFSGELGFDLANKMGTGQATFVDHKESYFNDHNIKVDVTGPKLDSDTDEKDFSGNEGATNYMLVEYNSRNGSSASSEKRTEPDNGNGLKGRFSIHSLGSVLDIISGFLTSKDPRFERLTNLFNNVMTSSTIGTILKGNYFETLAKGFLSASNVNPSNNSITLTFKPGLIKESYPLQIRAVFNPDYLDEENVQKPGKIKTLEVLSLSPYASEGTDLYVKITFSSAAMKAFNFAGQSTSSFPSYSSISHLLTCLMDTMTLGSTATSYESTYHLSLSVSLKILLTTYDIGADVFVHVNGTSVEILGALTYDKITPIGLIKVINESGAVNIFYRSTGDDSVGELYITKINNYDGGDTSEKTKESRRVRGDDFMENLSSWLTWTLNLGSTVSDRLNGSSSSSKEALHGEDLIKSFSTSGSSSSSSWSWKANIGIMSLLPSSYSSWLNIDDIPVTITGKKVTDNIGDKHTKSCLYSLSGNTTVSLISIDAASATISASLANISTGTYVNAWTNDNSAKLYYGVRKETKKVLFITINYYYLETTTGTASSLFNGNHGMSNRNSDYWNRGYSVTP